SLPVSTRAFSLPKVASAQLIMGVPDFGLARRKLSTIQVMRIAPTIAAIEISAIRHAPAPGHRTSASLSRSPCLNAENDATQCSLPYNENRIAPVLFRSGDGGRMFRAGFPDAEHGQLHRSPRASWSTKPLPSGGI